MFFVPNMYIIEDSWLENTSLGKRVQKRNFEDRSVLTPLVVNTAENDQSTNTDSTKVTEANLKNVYVQNVGTHSDTTFTNYHEKEKNEFCITVQNVQGESPQNYENIFIGSTSDYESDDSDEEGSVSYIAQHVEKIDLLNFDDSDVSIAEEDYDELI